MPRSFRPKFPSASWSAWLRHAGGGNALLVAMLGSGTAWAQMPISSSYSTRDGRIVSYVLACASTDGSFTAQPCGVAGYPVHVAVDNAVSNAIPATAAGIASGQVVGVQGGGAGALPVAVAVSTLPLPAGAATAALQPGLDADGGAHIHVLNFPAAQAVTNAGSFAVQDAAMLAATATLVANTAARSVAWADASFTATATASFPPGLAAVAGRSGLHVWNLGTATLCLNYTALAVASGTGCAAGSVPLAAGSAYLEDLPGNVSPEAISLVCTGSSCPVTIKVR